MTTTPEVTVTEELPAKAWLIIEQPTGKNYIVGGSDAAAEQALTHWSAA